MDTNSKELLKTFPVYEEVEGLQVLPTTGEFSGKFPSKANGGGLVAVAGKNGVVRVFAVDGQVRRGGDRWGSRGEGDKYMLTCSEKHCG